MNISIHGKNLNKEKCLILEKIIDNIKLQNINVQISRELYENFLKKNLRQKKISFYSSQKELKSCDYIFSYGGDGTLLDTITHIGDLPIPILGINIGKLGFLSTISIDEINNTIEILKKNKLKIEKRSLVSVSMKPNIYLPHNYALNEFSIIKKDSSSMLTIYCFANDVLLNTYWSDGLIISTPTGSTGYSLSCGGPIVSPNTKGFIITPISPHNLSVRPLIVSENTIIKLKIESQGYNFLTSLDSRSYTCKNGSVIKVVNSNFKILLAKTEDYSFFNTLRNKLNWGYDLRN